MYKVSRTILSTEIVQNNVRDRLSNLDVLLYK
jgi:hypothetical protein